MIRVAQGHADFNYSVERETFDFGKKKKKYREGEKDVQR